MSIFEEAARNKVRFQTSKGHLAAEDLFDLPLTSTTGKINLDDMARHLYKELKESEEISFVADKKTSDKVTRLKFDIVKRVIEIRKEEAEVARKAKERRDQKQRLMQLLEQKQDESLQNKSLDELKKMLEELDQ